MAKKKKSKGGAGSVQKALAGIDRAQRELQLNIKNLKAAMGHIHKPGGGAGQGHIHKAGGAGQGHIHLASGKTKGGARPS
ncbi:MAG: hypothetical protein ACRD2U_04175 [Terriglobales bacterium]